MNTLFWPFVKTKVKSKLDNAQLQQPTCIYRAVLPLGLQHNSTDLFHVNLLDGSYRTLLSQRGDGEMVHTLNERSSDGEEVSPALSLSFCIPQTERAWLLWEQWALPCLSNRSTLLSSCARTKGYLQGAKAERNFMQQIKDVSVALKRLSCKISKVGCKQGKLLQEFFNNLI